MGLLLPVILLLSVWVPAAILVFRRLPIAGPGRGLFCLGSAGIMALIASGAMLWLGLVLTDSMHRWLPIVTFAALALLDLCRKPKPFGMGVESSAESTGDSRLGLFGKFLIVSLSTLIALRFCALLPDVFLRPLFAWDAWTVWGYEARVWLETGGYVDFLPPGEWLTAPAGEYLRDTLVPYPKLVPALILWVVPSGAQWTGVGPGVLWLALIAFIALVIAGGVLLAGGGRILALAAAYAFISLPLINAHVALYGYADLWVAAAVSVFAGFLVLAERDQRILWLVLACLSLLALPLIKSEGSYWLVCGLAAVLLARLGIRPRLVLAMALSAVVGVLLAGMLGWDLMRLVSLGRLSVSTDYFIAALAGGARHAFFWFDWHLLGFFSVLMLIWLIRLPAKPGERRYLATFCVLGLVVLWGFTPLTGAAEFLSQGTLFSRILLQFSPALIVLGAILVRRLIAADLSAQPAPDRRAGFGAASLSMMLAGLVLWGTWTAVAITEWGSETVRPTLMFEPGAGQWRVVEGQGGLTDQGFRVEAPGRRGRVQLAIELPEGLRAKDYEQVILNFSDSEPSSLSVGWSTTRQFQPRAWLPLQTSENGSASVRVGDDREWTDPIFFLAVEQAGFVDGPWALQSIELAPGRMTFLDAQRILWDSFFIDRPWVQRNPHFLWPGDPVPRISVVFSVATWVCLSVLLLYWNRVRVRRFRVILLFVPLLASWLVLDFRWQLEVGQKAHASVVAFWNQSPNERFANDLDGALFDFLERLRAENERSQFQRILALSDTEFWRKRARYHLAEWGVRPIDGRALDSVAASNLSDGDLMLLLRLPEARLETLEGENQTKDEGTQTLLSLNDDQVRLRGKIILQQSDWIAFRVSEVEASTP